MIIHSIESKKGTQPAIGEISLSGKTIYIAVNMIAVLREDKLFSDIYYDFMMCRIKEGDKYLDAFKREAIIFNTYESAEMYINKH